jgi:hypothetical protein
METKREALRERHRIAANKCRQQKRAWINELQVKEKVLISRKHYLNMVVEILRNELVVLGMPAADVRKSENIST